MGKPQKYEFGDLSPKLLELVHQRPHLVVLVDRLFEKSIHFTGVWAAARTQQPDLRMEDVVKFCHQLRMDLKNSTVPEFAVYEEGLLYYKKLLEIFNKQDVEIGTKAAEPRVSSILQQCQRLRLLSLIQAHRDVLLTADPAEATLDAIVFRLDQQGFPMEKEKVARFVVTVKNSLKKGTLPSFVAEEDAEHFQNLLDAPVNDDSSTEISPTPRRSRRKSARKTSGNVHVEEENTPTSRPDRKRKADEAFQTPVRTPKPTPSQSIIRFDDQGKIVIMRHCIATDCEVLRFGSQSSWDAFMAGLKEQDSTIAEETHVKSFLQNLKQKFIMREREPSFSPEGKEVFAELLKVYRSSSQVQEATRSFGGLTDQQKVVLMRRCIATTCDVLVRVQRPPWNEFFDDLEVGTIHRVQARQFLKHLKQRSIIRGAVPFLSPEGKEVFEELLQVYYTALEDVACEKTGTAIGCYIFSHLRRVPELLADESEDDANGYLPTFAGNVSKVAGFTMEVADLRDLMKKWKHAYLENHPLPSFIANNKSRLQMMSTICGGPPKPKDPPEELEVEKQSVTNEAPEADPIAPPIVVKKAPDEFATPPSSPVLQKRVKLEAMDSFDDDSSMISDPSMIENSSDSLFANAPMEEKPAFVVPLPAMGSTLPVVKREVTDSGYGDEKPPSFASESVPSSQESLQDPPNDWNSPAPLAETRDSEWADMSLFNPFKELAAQEASNSIDQSTNHPDSPNKTTYDLTPL